MRGLTGEELRLVLAVLALALVFALWRPDAFATASNARNVTRQSGVLAIVSVGQTFPLLVAGFDISVGSVVGLSSVMSTMVAIRYGVAAGLVTALLVGALVGLVNGLLVARFSISPFIVTLGMLSFARGLALQLTNGTSVIGLPKGFAWLGANDWGPLPATVGIAAIVFALAAFLLHRTRAGLYFFAIGGNEEATRLSGINVVFYKTLAYVVSGLLAGLAGVVLTSRVFSGQPSLGAGLELQSIATAVIGGVAIGGGRGTLIGVALAVVLLSILSTGMNIAGFSTYAQAMLAGVVIVGAALWDRFRRARRS